MPAETVTLDGHVVDSLTLSKVLDLIVREGGTYRITQFDVGATRADSSHVEMCVYAEDDAALETILHAIQQHGALRSTGEAVTLPDPIGRPRSS
jgi:hypothetical protein